MKRFLSFLAATLLWPIWRAPAWAQLTTLGAGGVAAVVIGALMTPSIVPLSASYFNQNAANGATNNGLKPNNGVAGALEFPSAAANSAVIYVEGSVDSALGYSSSNAEYALSSGANAGLTLSGNSAGQPAWLVQRSGAAWWNAVSTNTLSGGSPSVGGGAGALATYATGYYPFTATGGGCAREPSGVWKGGGVASVVDPGFNCGTAPTVDPSTIPGDGAQQSTGAGSQPTTCQVVNGVAQVTAHLAVAHGIAPGQSYKMQGFLPAGYGTNATPVTYTALLGTTGTTLVGTSGAATCPGTVTQEGAALSGVGATITMVPISPTNPYLVGVSGITTKNAQHFCGIVGEYGADSNFPGAQFASFVDERGNALPGAPALVPNLNQGTANFTGYVTAAAQSLPFTATAISAGNMTTTGSPALSVGQIVLGPNIPAGVTITGGSANSWTISNTGISLSTSTALTANMPSLHVTAMNSYTLSAASYSATTGFVTFTTSASPGFIPGSEFTVSGVSPSGYNQTYVAVAGTSGTNIVGSPLSAPLGTPQAIGNPGAYSAGGTMVSVIMPNMVVLGAAGGTNISPFGTFGSTGAGGVGTYGLIGTPTTFSVTVSAITASSGGFSTMTIGSSPSPALVVGQSISVPSYGTIVVTAVLSGTGATGSTYTVLNPNTAALSTSTASTAAGTIGSPSLPVTIFAFPNHYFTAVPSITASAPYGGVTTAKSQATLGDFWSLIGSTSLLAGSGHQGWGGALANVSMLWGTFPQTTSGAPDTTKLASLCKKTTDIQSFAAANSLTVHSLYRLNDPGIWGDSSAADFTGDIAGTALTIDSTQSGTTTALPANTVISGPGITGCPLACPKILSGSGANYILNASGGTLSSVAMKAGAYAPATPLASNNFNGYIDNGVSGTVPTLHVTSIPTGATTTFTGSATFTGTLGNEFTGNIPVGSTINVTSLPLPGYVAIGVGTTIVGSGIPAGETVTGFVGSALGLTGSYTLSIPVTTAVPSEAMFATGILPAAASSIMTASAVGTVSSSMIVTDGGVNITGSPIALGAAQTAINGVPVFAINQTYYPASITYTGLVGTLTTLVPGQYIQTSPAAVSPAVVGPPLSTPVSIIGYGTGTGGVGTYLLSNGTSNGVGGNPATGGSAVAFIATGIGDAAAVAPGPALTIKDLGAGVAFPVTNFTAGTGTVTLAGTFDTSALDTSGNNTAPTAIQAQVSLTAGGPPVPGCSACAWTNLSGYTATLSSGTVWDWKGQALNIPAGGPLFISVRAANGTAYATLPSYIKVGLIFDWQGEGQAASAASNQGGTAISSFTGLWGLNQWFGGNSGLEQGPPIVANYTPAQTIMAAGDRFGVLGGGLPLAEGVGVYEQLLTNAFGWPAVMINTTRDSIGISPEVMGNVVQTQTIDVGDGTTTVFCSASKFCGAPGVSPAGPLFFNAAAQTGANITATIDNGSGSAGTTLTTSALTLGALEPGMSLTDATGGISGSPTLVSCISGCIATGVPLSYPAVQKWTITGSAQLVTSEAMRADPPGGAPWPSYNVQSAAGLSFVNGGGGTQLVQAGTFKINVNGTVVCQDTNTFAYNSQGGNCTTVAGSPATVTSSFVNYATGDYQVTFATAPASNAAITASWTNIISPDANQSPTINRPQGFDFFGNGKSDSGPMSSAFAKTPGGVTGHVFAGGATDDGILRLAGYQFGAPGYTQSVSWLYGTRFPSLLPGQTASTPFISANPWRGEGPTYFNPVTSGGQAQQYALSGQWSGDVATKSTFSGTIASSVLTLSGAAVGPMWEGEVIDCVTVGAGCRLSQSSGVYITSLAGGSWGASGSSYNLSGASGVTATGSMQNAVYYTGPGPAFYSGPINDDPVQGGTSLGVGFAPHLANGAFAGRRVGARWAAQTWGGLTTPANASDPTVDRVKADAGTNACDTSALAAPCFDVGIGGAGGPYAASHTGTISGAQITITGGIAAHDRPFVVGQALFCSGCTTGRFITAVSLPPTQDARTGQGQVGQTFTITANASLLTGPTMETVTAGCSGTAGTGSNCIDIAFQINTTNGTYGTAAALATCGENNLNGTAPLFQPPAGICQTNGIGSLVRGFRIGTQQATWGLNNTLTPGTTYDDGAEPDGGAFIQSSAFTCNIVAAKVVQCVKGAAYDQTILHTLASIGQWPSTGTYVEYGDSVLATGREGALIGYVGGQPFPAGTPGSGGTTSSSLVGATVCATVSGGALPKMDITTNSSGTIVNAYPGQSSSVQTMGVGVPSVNGTSCVFAATSGGGSVSTIFGPPDGVGGLATYNTDSNMMGDLLYDNSGLPGNPLNSFFTNGFGGYFEPGLPVQPFGGFMGAQVSG